MANMGYTQTINVSNAMMVAAIEAIDAYQERINNLNSSLQEEIDGLIPSSFSGSAAQGFKTFYEKNIVPNTGVNLTNLLGSLRGLCDSVKAMIPGEENGVDEQLGKGNQNPGVAAGN